MFFNCFGDHVSARLFLGRDRFTVATVLFELRASLSGLMLFLRPFDLRTRKHASIQKKKKKWRTDGERNLRYRGWISSVLYHNLEGRSSDPSINSYLPFITRKAELKALELMKVKIPKVNARSRSSPLIQRKSLLYTFPCPFFFFFFSYLHPHSRKTREITTCVNFGTFHNSQVDFPQLTNILPAHSLTARPTNIDPILFTALGILISYHLVTLVSALFI